MPGLDKEVVLDNQGNNFFHRMNRMRKEKNFCDVSFNVKGQEFHCHILMMINATLNSSYFESLFNSSFSESANEFKDIPLQDIEPEAFEAILTAIYTIRFHLHRGNAYFILRASHMLLLTDIFDATVTHVMENLDIYYLIDTCMFAQKAEREDLFSECIENINTIDLKTGTKGWATVKFKKEFSEYENPVLRTEKLNKQEPRYTVSSTIVNRIRMHFIASKTEDEKYDTKLGKWTCIPSLPQRLNFTRENITLATGHVFNCTVE